MGNPHFLRRFIDRIFRFDDRASPGSEFRPGGGHSRGCGRSHCVCFSSNCVWFLAVERTSRELPCLAYSNTNPHLARLAKLQVRLGDSLASEYSWIVNQPCVFGWSDVQPLPSC